MLPHLQFRVPLDVLFEELLQNARRAHAKQIQVVVADSGAGRTTVTVGDDGRGIADPSVLLDAGRSGWDTPIAAIEPVCGLGFFALAPYGCQVISHPVPESGVPQWTAILEPVHFTGRRAARVTRTHVDLGNQTTGTALHFTLPEDPDTVAAAVKDAARYFNLPVRFSDDGPKNLQPLPQQDILDGAILQEEWNHVTIAVRESRVRYDEPDLCVAGRPFRVDLPVVYTPDGGFFATVAYARHCRDLEITRGHVPEIAEGAFLGALRAKARDVAVRAAASVPGATLYHDDWRVARSAGISARYDTHPHVAQVHVDDDEPLNEPLDARTCYLVDTNELGYGPTIILARAASLETPKLRLIDARSSDAGHPGCAALWRVTHTETLVSEDGIDWQSPAYEPEGPFATLRPHLKIRMRLEDPNGQTTFRDVTADLALACPPRVIRKSAADARLVIRTDHGLTPDVIADILHQGFFDPSDSEPDLNHDFHDYLHDRNEQTARTVAAFILHGPEAAVRAHYQYPRRPTLPEYLQDRFDVRIDVKLTPRAPGRDKT